MKRTFWIVIALMSSTSMLSQKKPVLSWNFEQVEGQVLIESMTGIADSLTGKFNIVETGATGMAYKPDGFTGCIDIKSSRNVTIDGSFSVEAWVSQAAYPWNWAPVLASLQSGSQRQEGTRGFYFGLGPKGQLGLDVYIEGELFRCISEDYSLPLYEWSHIAAVYNEEKGITIYINGKEAGWTPLKKKFLLPGMQTMRIGMNYNEVKPSHNHRQFGTLPYWFSIDGALDEIKLYDSALELSDLNLDTGLSDRAVPFSRRSLPVVKTLDHFGAVYTKLKYYEEWDEQWPVGSHPDIVVNFESSPVRLVFWRGTRYSPAWVSEDDFWMADQSVEAWNNTEGCYEHMQDRHCKYSHVRIIENTPARVVVHWRYAPVSAYNLTWNIDEKTGWECWIDEYYYIYPDASAIRHVEWKTGSLGYPRQFQESIPIAGEGQLRGDIMDNPWLTVANQKGVTQVYEYVNNPIKDSKAEPDNPDIQKHNFKSKYDPFIIFETGNKMNYLGDRDIENLNKSGSCNHWPVGQAYCDGRTAYVADRPTSFLGFPISNPVVTVDGDRSWWNGLYGMTDNSIDYLVELSRSWNNAPDMMVNTVSPVHFDKSQRAFIYDAEKSKKHLLMNLNIEADKSISNFALVIKNAGGLQGDVSLQNIRNNTMIKTGRIIGLSGDKLIIWVEGPIEKDTILDIK